MAPHHIPQAPAARRRILIGLATLGASSGIVLAPNGAFATSAHPDAQLIALCGDYMQAITVYNSDAGNLEPAIDPLWQAVGAIEGQLDGLTAKTLEGILAKARVAMFHAQLPDGREEFCTSYTGDWPEQVVRDLLRLHGGAA